MIANLYICSKSIAHNATDTYSEAERKIFNFGEFLNKVRILKSNLFYVNSEDFLVTPILPNKITVEDLINGEKTVNKDLRNLFLLIFNICKKSTGSLKDMVDYLELEDENTCHALIVINFIEEIPKSKQILCNFDEFIIFRRIFLAKYPKSPEFFLDECRKYFPNLKFHDNIIETVKPIIHTHPHSIVKHLSCLSDNFISDFNSVGLDFVQFLNYFSIKNGLDAASLEGSKENKFYFNFLEDKSERKEYCEAHTKMYTDDSGNNNQHGRIYFSKPENWTVGTKIYIGFIGDHL
jgi:hypothetical protein